MPPALPGEQSPLALLRRLDGSVLHDVGEALPSDPVAAALALSRRKDAGVAGLAGVAFALPWQLLGSRVRRLGFTCSFVAP